MAMNSSGGTLPALRVHPAHQRLKPGHLPVEPDLRLVVQLHVARRRARAADRPAGRAGPGCWSPAWTRRPPRPYGPAWPGTSRRRRGAAAPRRPARGRGRRRRRRWPPGRGSARRGRAGSDSSATRCAGDAHGAGRGVADGQQHGELVAAEPGRLGAARQREPSRSAIWSSSRSPARCPRVSLTERKRSRSIRTRADRVPPFSASLQRRPGALQQPLAVGQPGQRVAQLLLGAGAGDPQRGVQGDQRHREQRQQHAARTWRRRRSAGRCRAARPPTRPCRTRAVRATVGSPPPRGASAYQSSIRVTSR